MFHASLIVTGREMRQNTHLSGRRTILLVDSQLHTTELEWSRDATRLCLLHCTAAEFGGRDSDAFVTYDCTLTMNASDLIDPIVANALASLDLLSSKDIPNLDDSCPICLMSFQTILEQRQDDLHGKAVTGVARVGGCGHMFCAEE